MCVHSDAQMGVMRHLIIETFLGSNLWYFVFHVLKYQKQVKDTRNSEILPKNLIFAVKIALKWLNLS